MLRAVLDANVYISAVIRPEGPPGEILQRFLRESPFELIVSADIVDEVRRALRYPKVRKYFRDDTDPEKWLTAVVLLADLVAGDYDVSGASADPDDDKYVAAALEGRATYLVTGDPDLLDVGEHVGVYTVTPRRFLTIVRGSPS